MPIGSSFGFGYSAGESFFKTRGYYTSGSLYKRFQLSNAQRLNREALDSYRSQINSTGLSIFSYNASASGQYSLLAVQQLQQRTTEAAQAQKVNIFA